MVGTLQTAPEQLPLDKHEFSPRLGFAYSWDQKTVIRGGYGVFWIPNYISFGLNPDNDVINLATTPFVATTDQGLTPHATLDGAIALWPVVIQRPLAARHQGHFDTAILPPPDDSGRHFELLLPRTASPPWRRITTRNRATCNSRILIFNASYRSWVLCRRCLRGCARRPPPTVLHQRQSDSGFVCCHRLPLNLLLDNADIAQPLGA